MGISCDSHMKTTISAVMTHIITSQSEKKIDTFKAQNNGNCVLCSGFGFGFSVPKCYFVMQKRLL